MSLEVIMADIKQDQFSLQYSDSFSIQGIQEANIDLQLEGAPVALGTVYGTVTDGTDPIPNATVKLFDQAGLPYRHTITGPDGRYVLTDIPVGTYSLAAVAEGLPPQQRRWGHPHHRGVHGDWPHL